MPTTNNFLELDINMPYELPQQLHRDWDGTLIREANFTPRQAEVMAAVRTCLDEGLYYTKDVFKRAVELLNPSTDQLLVDAQAVDGGRVGMDIYYARKAIEAQAERCMNDAIRDALQLRPEESPGVLVFNDLKRINATRIETITANTVTIKGKRGSNEVKAVAGFVSFKSAIERAFERGHRKDSYEAFLQKRTQPQAREQLVVETAEAAGSLDEEEQLVERERG